MTCDCVETSKALTGSSHTSSFGSQGECPGDGDALALPAGELVGLALRARASPGPTCPRSSTTRCSRCATGSSTVWMASGSPTMSAMLCRGSRDE